MAFVKVYTNGEERTVFLGDKPLLFGRGKDVDCLLNDPKASRHHCILEPGAMGLWTVRDLGSGNGTKVNGRKIEGSHVLEPEDAIQVGDARILFAGQAVAVVEEPSPRASHPTAPPEAREEGRRGWESRRKPSKTPYVVGGFLILALAGLALFWPRDKGGPRDDLAESAAYSALARAEGDQQRIEKAQAYLMRFPSSRRTREVKEILAASRKRVADGTSGLQGGYDPLAGLEQLTVEEAIAQLERRLQTDPGERRPAIEAALKDYRGRLDGEREKFFARLERDFARLVEEGQYARAREMWFFLRGDEDWAEMPEEYERRIVDRMSELENSAARDRSELFGEIGKLEAAHDFKQARELLTVARDRFAGTSVVRSIDERLDFVRTALKTGAQGTPRTPTKTPAEVDFGKQAEALLVSLKSREFAKTAQQLRALAKKAKKTGAYALLDARASECEAAAALHAALGRDLASGKLPKAKLAKQWRVLGGSAESLQVRGKSGEQSWPWPEVPATLYLELLRYQAEREAGGPLGLAVIAHAIGTPAHLATALEVGYADERLRPYLDGFVAARVRNEPMPQGGYIVDAGDILNRKEYLRRKEEELIARYRGELVAAYDAIRGHKAFKKLEKFNAKKADLDQARNFALKLIFDEKKYFYPYRGTGRMGEYNKVQQEVDRRVDAVRELWEDRATLSVKSDGTLDKALKSFDTAAAELTKRLVDVDDKVLEIDFLRSYLGTKFTVRTFFRSAEERDLLRYSVEVMKWNPTVKGDITEPEREQVRVTNEYRMMFGRWPVRVAEKLTLSSRGHCEEMSRLGYFGHFSPTEGRRTPYDRMKLAGYEYGASENCAAGSTAPLGVHNQWCHSSGHHRNLLMAPWTEMGSGQYGRLWTQNFGRAPKWSEHDEAEKEEAGSEEEQDPAWAPWEDEDDDEEEGGDEGSMEEGDEGYDYGD